MKHREKLGVEWRYYDRVQPGEYDAYCSAAHTIQGEGQYIFWTGESNPKSCVGDWQRSLRRVFRWLAYLAVMRTGSAIPLPWSSFWLVSRWSVSRCFSAIKA